MAASDIDHAAIIYKFVTDIMVSLNGTQKERLTNKKKEELVALFNNTKQILELLPTSDASDFTCCVCMDDKKGDELHVSPVNSCKMHHVCNGCYEQLTFPKRCPLCRTNWSDIPEDENEDQMLADQNEELVTMQLPETTPLPETDTIWLDTDELPLITHPRRHNRRYRPYGVRNRDTISRIYADTRQFEEYTVRELINTIQTTTRGTNDDVARQGAAIRVLEFDFLSNMEEAGDAVRDDLARFRDTLNTQNKCACCKKQLNIDGVDSTMSTHISSGHSCDNYNVCERCNQVNNMFVTCLICGVPKIE